MTTDWTFDLNAFGERVRARRLRLKYRQDNVPDGPSSTYMSRIENGTMDEFTDETIEKLSAGLKWDRETLIYVLRGKASIADLPVDIEPDEQEKPPASETMFQRLTRQADEALDEFERAVENLVAAESKADKLTRRVFAYMAFQDKVGEEIQSRQEQLGRAMSQLEIYAIDGVERPSEAEIAALIASWAEHGDRELTRYELALHVKLNGLSLASALKSSSYLDLSDALAKAEDVVRREETTRLSVVDGKVDLAALDAEPGLDQSAGESTEGE